MRVAEVYYDNVLTGLLTETEDGQFTFQYDRDYITNFPNQFITFTMPVREQIYQGVSEHFKNLIYFS